LKRPKAVPGRQKIKKLSGMKYGVMAFQAKNARSLPDPHAVVTIMKNPVAIEESFFQ
jgi:hypothetical protein